MDTILIKQPHTNFLDELKVITIHKNDIDALTPPEVKQYVIDNIDFEHYPDGLKDGKTFDKIEEFKLIISKIEDMKKLKGNEESNMEGLLVDKLSELFRKMTLQDVRTLHLERLL